MDETHQLGYGPVNEDTWSTSLSSLQLREHITSCSHQRLEGRLSEFEYKVHTSIHVSMLVVGCSYLWWSVVHCMLTVTTDVVCACLREICVHTVQ